MPLDTQGGEAPLFDSDNVELGLVARYTHPVLGDMRQFGELIDFSETPGRIAGPPPLVGQDTRAVLRELGHQRPRDRRADRRRRLLRARRPLRRTLRELARIDPMIRLRVLPPGAHTGFLGDLCVPDDLYWIAREPVALAGMSYPGRADWTLLHENGIGHVVCLSHDAPAYDPAPCTITAIRLQDLVSGGDPNDPERERALVEDAAADVVAHLERGIGVAVHCMGGRGRTGTVIGVALVTLGHDPDAVVAHLDRVAAARGRRGWPESPWQSAVVGSVR